MRSRALEALGVAGRRAPEEYRRMEGNPGQRQDATPGVADAGGSSRPPSAPPRRAADGAGSVARPRVSITVTDPVHVSVESARLYAEIVLRAQDLADVPLEVVSVEVACAACGAANHPEPHHPFCDACGWPLPRASGPEVEVSAAW
jgi:hypothetical protein